MGEDKFYIVNEKSLPEIFKKVIEVKENIELGNAKDISEAIKLVGISRCIDIYFIKINVDAVFR